MKAAFCDRDGTITEEHSDDDWPTVKKPTIRSGSIEGLQLLSRNGFDIFIVTNQPLIGEGKLTLDQYEEYTRQLVQQIESAGVHVRDIFMCPHPKSAGCRCCKPMPGMIELALARYPSINLSKSFVIGDRISDVELAVKFDLRSFSIGFDSSNAQRVESILEAARILETIENQRSGIDKDHR